MSHSPSAISVGDRVLVHGDAGAALYSYPLKGKVVAVSPIVQVRLDNRPTSSVDPLIQTHFGNCEKIEDKYDR